MPDDSVVLGKQGAPPAGTPWQDSPPDISITETARDGIHVHVSADTKVERGGVLVGAIDHRACRVSIKGWVAATKAVGEVATLTFTHEAWNEIDDVMGHAYPDLEIVGWYHSHPHFGVFLSEYDLFIQRNFFSKPWQVAYVEDPLLGTSGFFGWERGEITRLDSWSVRTRGGRASVGTPDRGQSQLPTAFPSPSIAPPPPGKRARPPAMAWLIITIAALLIGLIGGIVAGGATRSAATGHTGTKPTLPPTVKTVRVYADNGWSISYAVLPRWVSNDREHALVEISAEPYRGRHPTLAGSVENCGPPNFKGTSTPLASVVGLLVSAIGSSIPTTHPVPVQGLCRISPTNVAISNLYLFTGPISNRKVSSTSNWTQALAPRWSWG